MERSTVLRLGGLVAVMFVLAGTVNGAAATNQPDLSSRAAIQSYLQSIGIDPASVTWQQGLNNYAGPSCPGVGWTCTTATRVVQIAPAGGENSVECTPDDQSCVIVQSTSANGSNHAKCEEHSSAPVVVQECTVTQASPTGSNDATVLQDDRATAGESMTGAQNAQQLAHVEQNSGSGDNHSDVHQSIGQSLTLGSVQKQDGYQAADVSQTASDGANFSHVHQTEDQQATGGTTQSQNTTQPPQNVDDCSGASGQPKPANPDQCAHVQQENVSGGTNGSQLDQAIGERQSTDAPTAQQTQGTFTGGQRGDVHQDNPSGVGQNMDVDHQALAQRQSAPTGAAETQMTDPGCCGASQNGGAKNHEDIDQSTTQSATGAAEQLSTLSGIVHQTPGGDFSAAAAPTGSTSNNTCDIDQHGRNNDGSGHVSVSGTGAECTFLTLETVCQSGPTPGSPASAQPASPACTTAPTGTPGVALPALVSLATTPTAGQPIAMPDYGTPTDYLAVIGG